MLALGVATWPRNWQPRATGVVSGRMSASWCGWWCLIPTASLKACPEWQVSKKSFAEARGLPRKTGPSNNGMFYMLKNQDLFLLLFSCSLFFPCCQHVDPRTQHVAGVMCPCSCSVACWKLEAKSHFLPCTSFMVWLCCGIDAVDGWWVLVARGLKGII